ncbi:unnamed protein product [Polarella glacialis]|uniref:Uncharacterized protein n=1 Tax=Polarella glacialis TaxID=89957 RepID=A0A813E1T0_POLGL|nr:unnamed protein product [Polarella glacialis]
MPPFLFNQPASLYAEPTTIFPERPYARYTADLAIASNSPEPGFQDDQSNDGTTTSRIYINIYHSYSRFRAVVQIHPNNNNHLSNNNNHCHNKCHKHHNKHRHHHHNANNNNNNIQQKTNERKQQKTTDLNYLVNELYSK